MTRIRGSRRRYLLLRGEKPFTPQAMESMMKRLAREHAVSSKATLWLDEHVIIMTNQIRARDIVASLDGTVWNGNALRSVAVSGVIGKLKRLAASSRVG